jgi:hypothetical protein
VALDICSGCARFSRVAAEREWHRYERYSSHQQQRQANHAKVLADKVAQDWVHEDFLSISG